MKEAKPRMLNGTFVQFSFDAMSAVATGVDFGSGGHLTGVVVVVGSRIVVYRRAVRHSFTRTQ